MNSIKPTPPIRLVCFAAPLPPEVKQGYFPAAEARVNVKNIEEILDYTNHFYAAEHIILAPDVHIDPPPLSATLAPLIEPALHDRCHGLWHGQNLRSVPQEALARYVREEDFAPPEGETGHQFQARISTWLLQATLHGCTLVVARPPVVRALAVHALGGQSTLTHHLDSEPETATILTHHAGHWRVRQYGARV